MQSLQFTHIPHNTQGQSVHHIDMAAIMSNDLGYYIGGCQDTEYKNKITKRVRDETNSES